MAQPVGGRGEALASRAHERSRSSPKSPQVTLALALCGSAAAYVAPAAKSAGVAMSASKADMADLAEANPDFLGSSLGLWDPLGAFPRPPRSGPPPAARVPPAHPVPPLGCLSLDFWTLGNEATIGYLRHAEIKHGRVAMAAFLGYLAQSTPVVSGPHGKLPFKGYEPGLTPPEQWDAIPLVGKLQIFGIIGMLESYGEILDVHYTNGGLPGYYPPIRGNRPELWFNLYDPFNWFDEDKDKVRGRQVEINNGRLAMLGILSVLSESKVPGSVPLITGLIPEYSGSYMVPFEADFSLFN